MRKLKLDVPLLLLLAAEDDEVSPATCRAFAARSGGPAGTPEVEWYGATHDFDDPGKTRQAIEAYRSARADALQRSLAFVDAVP